MPKMNNDRLTPKEKAYYTPDYDSIDMRLAFSVDSDTNSRINSIAAMDILYRRPVKTAKDFKTKAEYECYKGYLYSLASIS